MNTQKDSFQAESFLQWDGVKDLATAICIMLFAVGGFLFINPEDANVYPGEGGITWQTLPLGYSGLLLFLASIYAIQSLIKIRRQIASPPPREADPQALVDRRTIAVRRLTSLALLLVFASLLKILGLAILAPLFLFAMFRLYKRGSWQSDAAIAAIGGMCLWILFVPILQLNLKGDELDPVTPFLLSIFKAVGL